MIHVFIRYCNYEIDKRKTIYISKITFFCLFNFPFFKVFFFIIYYLFKKVISITLKLILLFLFVFQYALFQEEWREFINVELF